MSQIVEHLSEISGQYDALLVDLWGCVHNGITAFPDAVSALRSYRATGGAVVLVTNAPRPWASVEKQLDGFGVPKDAWDAITTSGDSARAAMLQGLVGRKVWHIGEPRDARFFAPMDVVADPVEISRVPMEQADGIVCTGPFDPLADPEEMRGTFLFAREKGLEMICANPDIVVDRGETREWCAGALAKLYTEMGGVAHYFGKPHPPIYDLAYRRLAALGRDVEKSRILAIGDGAVTDIPGAMGEGIDSLFISGGLAAKETQTRAQPDPEALAHYLAQEQIAPTYSIGFLR